MVSCSIRLWWAPEFDGARGPTRDTVYAGQKRRQQQTDPVHTAGEPRVSVLSL